MRDVYIPSRLQFHQPLESVNSLAECGWYGFISGKDFAGRVGHMGPMRTENGEIELYMNLNLKGMTMNGILSDRHYGSDANEGSLLLPNRVPVDQSIASTGVSIFALRESYGAIIEL